jgi:hypothetical protein
VLDISYRRRVADDPLVYASFALRRIWRWKAHAEGLVDLQDAPLVASEKGRGQQERRAAALAHAAWGRRRLGLLGQRLGLSLCQGR